MTTQTILTIFGVVIILLLLTRSGRESVGGICAVVTGQAARKAAHKEKALVLLQKGDASNEEIREALGVSDRTAVRYMDELEKEGKVEQAGVTGRGVMYRLR